MRKRILLDLDDVLNSWTLNIFRLYGIQCGPYEYSIYPREIGRDIVQAVNKLANRSMVGAYFWDTVPLACWSDAPKSLECDWLVDLCIRSVGVENVLIATSPSLDKESLGAKVRWIETHLPKELHRQYAITPRKWWLEGFLIDDHMENVDRAQFGVAMPRPWNDLWPMDLEQRKAYLVRALDKYLDII